MPHLPWELSKAGVRSTDDSGDPGGGATAIGVIGDGTIEGWLDLLGGRSNAAGVEGTTRGSQGSAAHPADQEELTLGPTHASLILIVPGGDPDRWWQDLHHVSREFVPQGSRSYGAQGIES